MPRMQVKNSQAWELDNSQWFSKLVLSSVKENLKVSRSKEKNDNMSGSGRG